MSKIKLETSQKAYGELRGAPRTYGSLDNYDIQGIPVVERETIFRYVFDTFPETCILPSISRVVPQLRDLPEDWTDDLSDETNGEPYFDYENAYLRFLGCQLCTATGFEVQDWTYKFLQKHFPQFKTSLQKLDFDVPDIPEMRPFIEAFEKQHATVTYVLYQEMLRRDHEDWDALFAYRYARSIFFFFHTYSEASAISANQTFDLVLDELGRVCGLGDSDRQQLMVKELLESKGFHIRQSNTEEG